MFDFLRKSDPDGVDKIMDAYMRDVIAIRQCVNDWTVPPGEMIKLVLIAARDIRNNYDEHRKMAREMGVLDRDFTRMYEHRNECIMKIYQEIIYHAESEHEVG